MAASDKVALTVTYTPTSGVTSTVTVLGQVLNNGATNWVPTGKDNAIVLETASASDESSTVLDGTTYYLTTGPALPDQATGVTITVSPTSGTPTNTMSSQAQASSMPATRTTSATMQSSNSAASASSSTATSKNSGTSAKSFLVNPYVSKTGIALAGMFLVGAIWL